MDSLDSGGIMGGSGTIDKNQLEAIQKQQELLNKKIESKTQQNNEDTNITNYASKILNTQTRKDLADLERVYQNFAVTDSGLNTLIKTTNTSSNTTKEEKYEETSSTEPIGLQTIRAITSELENRAFQQILKEMDKNAAKKPSSKLTPRKSPRNYIAENMKTKTGKKVIDNEQDSGAWPPKKYEHIKGHGYGTSWSPASLKKSYTMSFGRTNQSTENLNTQTGGGRSRSSTRPIRRNVESNLNRNDSNYSSRASLNSSNNIDDGDKNNLVVKNLQSKACFILFYKILWVVIKRLAWLIK